MAFERDTSEAIFCLYAMFQVDYFHIIHKFIPPHSPLYKIYLPHVALVTAKALQIASRLELSREQLRFIEEAAMLHDIGVVNVTPYAPSSGRQFPYLCHAPLGRAMLEAEGLPCHALVAERHVGVGITRQEIVEQGLPLPVRDMVPESLEERIISWADLFYSKHPERLWREASISDVEQHLARYGSRQQEVFRQWLREFGCSQFTQSQSAGD